MNVTQLATELDKIGLPLSYNHFTEPPAPPYLVYLFSYSSDIIADDHNVEEIGIYQIELYTNKKDVVSEKKVEDKLKEIYLPYRKFETWNDSEKLYQIMYEVELI